MLKFNYFFITNFNYFYVFFSFSFSPSLNISLCFDVSRKQIFQQNGSRNSNGSTTGGKRPEVLRRQLFMLSATAVHTLDHDNRGKILKI